MNRSSFKKIFFARNNLKTLVYRSATPFVDVLDKFQDLSKKNLVNFTKISDPGYAKKIQKIIKNSKKFFFARNNLKYLSLRSATPFEMFLDKFQAKVLSKRNWSFFTKISDPGYAKKFKKWHQK